MVAFVKKRFLLTFIMLLAMSATLTAAEFSAQMVLKDRDRVMPGRIFVKDGKMRQEFLDEKGHTVTIVRRDKKVVWVLLPFDRTYLEMPLGLELPGQFLQIPPGTAKRRVCTEEVNGYKVERFDVTIMGVKGGPQRQTFWISEKLGLPIKTVCAERQFAVEYKNIREGKQEDRLFEVPPEYKKISGLTKLP